MPIKVESKIEVPDIEVRIDEEADDYPVDGITKEWGPNIPIIQINDYVVNVGNIISYEVDVTINQLSEFDMTIRDGRQELQNALKNNDNNTGIIFFGNAEYYHKHKFIILETYSDVNNIDVTLSGYIYVEDFYNTKQKKYDEMSVDDIISELADTTKIGYFINDNSSLTKIIPEIINPGKSYINFINEIITKYTNNVWSMDTNYIMHVGNLESFLSKEVSKFNFYENKKLPAPLDILLSNDTERNSDADVNEDEAENYLDNVTCLKFTNFSIDNKKHNILKNVYGIADEHAEETELFNNTFGVGTNTENYFSGFKDKYYPNYSDIINKQILGNVITVSMDNTLLEIFPFMTLNLELLIKNPDDGKFAKNEKVSGKRIVVGYKFVYNKTNTDKGEKRKIRQQIKLI